MKPPVAEELRPKNLNEIVGQEHILGPQGFIANTIEQKRALPIILWGPPGSGKTSIARLYAKAFSLHFESLSAIFSGIQDLKKILKETMDTPLFKRSILLFVDEIHRFNKSQQDAFLPFLENGSLILIGATTENPSFYLNKALLSRVRVLKLNILDETALEKILCRYEEAKGPLTQLTAETRSYLIQMSHGDGRYLLNLVENLEGIKETLSLEKIQHFLQEKPPLFDKKDDQHYDLISALHKSIRGSDPDAALYWLARILAGGEDPLFIARRVIRIASEDIGLADPQALGIAIAARDAFQMLGSPEGELSIAQAIVYLATAPKSNSIYRAFAKAKEAAEKTSHLPPPRIILNSPTNLMKELNYGKGYIYDHDTPDGFSGQNYFPDSVNHSPYYTPVERGFEREIKKRLCYFEKLRTLKNQI
jgi:putative ATPase